MRIRFLIERASRRIKSRLLTSRLERMAAELGPASYRTPEFLNAEMKVALALAALAEIEYEIGETAAAERAYGRADQIYTALRRFLPHADLDAIDRRTLDRRMERLRSAMVKVSCWAMAA